MFTGIVERIGTIVAVHTTDGGARLRITDAPMVDDVQHGDSIAVSGVCLTVVAFDEASFEVDVMAESLQRTTIGTWREGTRLNLERSVTASSRLGGHIVQGHVDGTAELLARDRHPAYDLLTFRTGSELGRYLAGKGAIALDGISLTVIDVRDVSGGTEFTIGVIPETQRATTLGELPVGAGVNVEADVLAKYVERLLTAPGSPAAAGRR